MSFGITKYKPTPAKKYYMKCGPQPISFTLSTSGKSIALAAREHLVEPLTESEYLSLDIQALKNAGHLGLLRVE